MRDPAAREVHDHHIFLNWLSPVFEKLTVASGSLSEVLEHEHLLIQGC